MDAKGMNETRCHMPASPLHVQKQMHCIGVSAYSQECQQSCIQQPQSFLLMHGRYHSTRESSKDGWQRTLPEDLAVEVSVTAGPPCLRVASWLVMLAAH